MSKLEKELRKRFFSCLEEEYFAIYDSTGNEEIREVLRNYKKSIEELEREYL